MKDLECHVLKLHDRKMKDSVKAIVAEILAEKMEMGLKLRQAMLSNGVLFNSEAWHDVNEAEMKSLESVDEHLKDPLLNPIPRLQLSSCTLRQEQYQ